MSGTKISCLYDCQLLAANRDGLCLSLIYHNQHEKLQWQCKQGHIWSACALAIKTGSWCPYCSPRPPKTINDAKELASKNNGLCLSDVYINSETKLIWQCQHDHIWENTYAHIRNGQWCPYCARGINSTENKVRQIFEEIFSKPFPSIRPTFLKNETTGHNLELDGYCEELQLAFEYDGRMHYEERSNYITPESIKKHSCLTQIQDNDRLKDKLCLENSIILIRIPYWYKDNLHEYIRQQLLEKGVIHG